MAEGEETPLRAGRLPPETETRSAYVYQCVRGMILRGELQPGKPISRRSLSGLMGVSFVPVTEAMQRLEYEGLLESKARAGTRVRVPSLEEVQDLFIVREALETQSARLFTAVADRKQKSDLLESAIALDGMISTREVTLFDYDGRHQDFHRQIAKYTKCPGLAAQIERTHAMQQAWIAAAAVNLQVPMQPNHAGLMSVLAGDDVEASDSAMRSHLTSGRDVLVEALRARLGEVKDRKPRMRRGVDRAVPVAEEIGQ